jgi:hypothetical protein
VLSLEDGKDRSVGMTVGFRPSRVFFSNDGKKGFVVTEDGVSILDFDAKWAEWVNKNYPSQ